MKYFVNIAVIILVLFVATVVIRGAQALLTVTEVLK